MEVVSQVNTKLNFDYQFDVLDGQEIRGVWQRLVDSEELRNSDNKNEEGTSRRDLESRCFQSKN